MALIIIIIPTTTRGRGYAVASERKCLAHLNCSSTCGKSQSIENFVARSGTMPNATYYNRPWWRTCAVVGSSGALLNEGLGPTIDAHDAVFRANYAPFQGFEADVGSRTTVRIANKNITGDEMLVKKKRGKDCREKLEKKDLPALPIVHASDVAALHCLQSPSLNLSIELPPNAPKLTTGMLATAVALNLCQYVVFFGFDSHEDYLEISDAMRRHEAFPHPYHYFDKRHPGHETEGFKNDSTKHLVPVSTHDIAAEDKWRTEYLQSARCVDVLTPPRHHKRHHRR
ncbi:hypothetical protein CTAYLR_004275 [Chrysophaeum taylorii]|uniref:Uncharacterized protein n=1 Tax=Chrysophaeum taylorii TaxID=2483200 RepID=A0AAD7UG23_9STRA|nr:hypothetical protein CTAYLR_004275 [Chrysophaeum taylorii]